MRSARELLHRFSDEALQRSLAGKDLACLKRARDALTKAKETCGSDGPAPTAGERIETPCPGPPPGLTIQMAQEPDFTDWVNAVNSQKRGLHGHGADAHGDGGHERAYIAHGGWADGAHGDCGCESGYEGHGHVGHVGHAHVHGHVAHFPEHLHGHHGHTHTDEKMLESDLDLLKMRRCFQVSIRPLMTGVSLLRTLSVPTMIRSLSLLLTLVLAKADLEPADLASMLQKAPVQAKPHIIGLRRESVPVYRRGRIASFKTSYSGAAWLPLTLPFRPHHSYSEFAKERLCFGGGGAADNHSVKALDLVDYDPLCVEMSIIVAVEMSSQPFKSFQFDGILGLGLPGLTMSRTSLDWLATQLLKGFVSISRNFSTFDVIVQSGLAAQPRFGVFLCDGEFGEESEVSFGGLDPRRVLEPISWSHVAMEDQTPRLLS
eukprot:g12397.t1